MATHALDLASNASLSGAASAPKGWEGGRAAFICNATGYGSAVNLQVQGPSGGWINVNSTTFSADQMTPYDLPAGQYRVNSVGSTTGLYAKIVGIPYY